MTRTSLLRGIAAISLLLPPAARAGELNHFCTMDQAADQMIGVSGIDAKGIYKDLGGRRSEKQISGAIRMIAEDVVKEKLKEGHGEKLEITWKDIYDMRGTVSAWVCNQGARLYCVSSFIDAVGSGLTGTAFGRGLTNAGLILAGPAGFIVLSGMDITQETFQCTPDSVAMAIDAGATVLILVPWCKAPGAEALCLRARQAAGKTVLNVMGRYLGKEYAIAAAQALESETGRQFVKVAAQRTANAGKFIVTYGVGSAAHSALVADPEKPPPPEAPGPAAPTPLNVPVGNGLYYTGPAACLP